MHHRLVVPKIVAILAMTQLVAADDWPAFRGPHGDGICRESAEFPTAWDESTNVAWKFALPAAGNSSPIVVGDHVFITCATDGGNVRSLYCVDKFTGQQRWLKSVAYDGDEPTHNTNPYCGSTPVANENRVIVWHGSAGLFCYDFAGNELWSVDPGDVAHIWGYGSSPVIHKDRVFLNHGPGEDSFLAAFDLMSGSQLWKIDEPGGTNDRSGRLVGSWATPIVIAIGGTEQLVCSLPTRVAGFRLSDGRETWSCTGLSGPRGDLAYASPSVAENRGVAFAGYKGPVIGFEFVTDSNSTRVNQPIWKAEAEQPQRIGSGVVVERHLYVANAGPGTLQCIDMATGNDAWVVRGPADHWGSVVLAGNLLYVSAQNGTTTVFRPNSSQFERVSSNPIDERSNSTPAFSGGSVFLRTFNNLYCIRSTDVN